MNRATKKIFLWIYTGIAAVLGGVGSAVLAAGSGQVFGAINFTGRQLISIAVGGAVTAAAGYLVKSPLPKIDDDLQTDPGKTPV
jgi:hypothetical protein